MIKEMQKYLQLKNPIFQVFLFLVILTTLSVVDLLIYEENPARRGEYVLHLASILGVTLGYYALNYYVLKLPNLNIANLGITSLILFLIVYPQAPFWMFPLTIMVTLLVKLVFRYNSQPIFNPAALGIFVTWLITLLLQQLGVVQQTLFESWWGADIQYTLVDRLPFLIIIPVLLLPAFVMSAQRLRKDLHSHFYLLTYVSLYLLYAIGDGLELNKIGETLYGLLTGSFVFLAYIMVSEPKTSPVLKDQQIYLGMAGGVILLLFSNIIPDFAPQFAVAVPTIAALLTLNAVTFVVKNKNNLFKKKTNVAHISASPSVAPMGEAPAEETTASTTQTPSKTKPAS